MTQRDIARLYRQAQESFVALAAELSDEDWARPSPCTPGWTARDVLSHVAGATLDIVAGNLDGAATPPWTAAQVDRWRDTPVAELLERWNDAVDPASVGLASIGEARPAFDCQAHEHDVRHAVGRPGNRDGELVTVGLDALTSGEFARALRFELADGDSLECAGAGEPLIAVGLTRFELLRSRLGRRSARQVAAWRWTEPAPDEVVRNWFVFGPAVRDIVE
jgi:uncharacterized protein (TIGR03083 family)